MRFFSLLDLQHMFLVFFLGVFAAIFTYLTWSCYRRPRTGEAREEKAEARGYEIESFSQLRKHPIAPYLVLLYAGLIAWILGYYLLRGPFGGPIF